MRVVDSKNSVSVGGILWNTTLEIEDLPLLLRRKGQFLECLASQTEIILTGAGP